jgi:putative sigma-54 modulation protein
MELNIKTKHIELTSQIEDYVQEKIGHLEKYDHQIMEVMVRLFSGKEHTSETKFRAEVTMHLPKTMLVAEGRGSDIHAAIDVVSEKIERQLEKHKHKMFGKKNQH